VDVAVAELVQHESDWWSALRRRMGCYTRGRRAVCAKGRIAKAVGAWQGMWRGSGGGRVCRGLVCRVSLFWGLAGAAVIFTCKWLRRVSDARARVDAGVRRYRTGVAGDAGSDRGCVCALRHNGITACELMQDVACWRPGWVEDPQMQADRV
jgi:hypothetical protein